MFKRGISSVVVCALLFLLVSPIAYGQDPKTSNPDAESEKQKLLQTKILAMVDSLGSSIQELKLPENRVRTAAALGNLLWSQDPDRARNLFRLAQNTLVSMQGAITTEEPEWETDCQNVMALRSEIVQMIASNDPEFALEFLKSTKMPSSVAPQWVKGNDLEMEGQIAQALAAKDPATALAKAEDILANGLSWNLSNIVLQLLQKDPTKAAILADEIAAKVSAEEMLSHPSQDAGILMNILSSARQYQANAEQNAANAQIVDGPVTTPTSPATLPDASFIKLLDPLVNAALKADLSGRDQNERGVAFGILGWMMTQDALIQKYEAAHSQEIQKKIAEYQHLNGIAGGTNLNQLMQTASPDAIVRAAANVPSSERI